MTIYYPVYFVGVKTKSGSNVLILTCQAVSVASDFALKK
jgi:hypothetical protein